MPPSTSVHKLVRPSVLPVYWLGLSLLMVGIDFLLGPHIQFPIVFVVPVGLAAWYSGWFWGVALGTLLPLVRLYFVSIWDVPWDFRYSVANTIIRIVVFSGVAILLARLAKHERELTEQVQTLEGLLPICSGCKKIRDEQQEWQPLERYISQRSAAKFTHGFCPPCARQYFGEFAEGIENG